MAVDVNKTQDMGLLLSAYADAIKGDQSNEGLAREVKADNWQEQFAEHGANIDAASIEEAVNLSEKLNPIGGDSFEMVSVPSPEEEPAAKAPRERGGRADSTERGPRTSFLRWAADGLSEAARRQEDPAYRAGRQKERSDARNARREEGAAAHRGRLQGAEGKEFERASAKAERHFDRWHGKLAAQMARDFEQQGVDVRTVTLGASAADGDTFSGTFDGTGEKFSFVVKPGSSGADLMAQFKGLSTAQQALALPTGPGIDGITFDTSKGEYVCDIKGGGTYKFPGPVSTDQLAQLNTARGTFPSGVDIGGGVPTGEYAISPDGKSVIVTLSVTNLAGEVENRLASVTIPISNRQEATNQLLTTAMIAVPLDAAAIATARTNVEGAGDNVDNAVASLEDLADGWALAEPAQQAEIYEIVYGALSSGGTPEIKAQVETHAIAALGMIATPEAVTTLGKIAKNSRNADYKKEAAESLVQLAQIDEPAEVKAAALAAIKALPEDLRTAANVPAALLTA